MASGSQAQDPIHRRYTTADGLASNTMYGMVQDHRGFLWFGTDAGASRFDGKYFVNYGLRDGLPDEEVLNLFEDSHHRMWMMLLNGKLAYVRNDTLYHPGNDPKLRSVTGRAGWARACEDRAGNIWFGGVWGELLMLDTLGGFHAIDTPNKGILQGQVTPLIDQNGDLFIQVNSQGFVMQDGILVHTFDFTIPGPTIMYARSPDGRWWSASTDGLLEIGRHPRQASVSTDRCGPLELVRSMAFSNESTIIYSRTDRGAVVVDTTIGTVREIFSQESINNTFIDDEGNCWLNTARDGILFFAMDQLHSRIIDRWGEQTLGAISRLHAGSDGRLWVGTESGFLLSMKDDDVRQYDLRIGDTRVQNVRALCDDGRSVFAATDLTTARLPLDGIGERGTVAQWDRRLKVLLPDAPNKLLTVLHDGTLIGAYYELMRCNAPGSNALHPFLTAQLGYGRFHLLYEDADSALWIQRNDTLYRWHRGLLRARPDLSMGYDSRATSMAALSDGTLVIGTVGHGLLFLRNGELVKNLRQVDGLISDRCKRIHVTGDTITMATSEGVGVVIMDPAGLDALSMRILEPVTFRMPATDALVLRGKLYVATAAGLLITDALRPRTQPQAPRLYVSRITSDELSFASGQAITVDHDHSSLMVEVTVVSFAQAMGTEFQYRIDDAEKWTASSTNAVALYTQQPGEHMLQVRARVIGSPWSAAVTTPFIVMPPFWDRLWFRVPAMIALVACAYLLLRFLARRRYQRHLELMHQREILAEERQRIAMDLHDDLGADLSGTAMLAEAALQNGQDASNALAETIGRVRGMVPKVDDIIWALDGKNDHLSSVIEHLERTSTLRARSQGVEFEFVATEHFGDRVIDSELRRVMMMLAKESLNNALKHARAKAIGMTVMVEDKVLDIEVQDNGIGLHLTPEAGKRHGLSNMRARAEQLGGTVTFTDVKPHGTRVTIELPLPK